MSIKPIILLIFFGGCDLLGFFIVQQRIPEIGTHIELWTGSMLQFSSFTTLLYWVPQMFIPGLLIALTLYYYIGRRELNYVNYLLLAATPLWSPFISIGILPFFLYYIIILCKNNGFTFVRKILDWKILLCCMLIGIIQILYFMGNLNSSDTSGFIWDYENMASFWWKIILFVFLEVALICIPIMCFNREKKFFLLTVVLVLAAMIIPHVGYCNDLTMRASIPALVMLFIMLAESINNITKQRNLVIILTTYIILILSSFSSINEIYRNITSKKSSQLYYSLIVDEPDFLYQYVSFDENSLYAKVISN